MDFPLIWLLPAMTFLAVIAFALWSKSRTEKKLHKDHPPKSSLAKDGPGPNPMGPDR
ncbi:MAG: hypothetical protein ACU0BF_10745 [Paracoccaceae bacterium]